MEKICGIYKITNLSNGKAYIGQSINIYGRWKQHTQSIDQAQDMNYQNPLRRAFCKYGLKEQVSTPGEYAGFKFEIIQCCQQDDLDKLEYDWIKRLNPEYNIMMCPPSADRVWPVKNKFESSCYVQYHNFNELDYMPYENQIFSSDDSSSYILSKKRDALRCKGTKIYLIVGIKQRGNAKKQFFLWGYEQIEEIECIDWFDGESKSYGLRGNYFKCTLPIELNKLDGFDSFFRKTMGSFAYGLQNAIKDLFCRYLMDESNFETRNDCINYLDWLTTFEEKNIKDERLRLTRHLDDGSNSIIFFDEGEDQDELMISTRSFGFFCEFPDKFADALKLQVNCKTIKYYLNDVARKFIPLVPDKRHVILYCDPDDWTAEMIADFSKYKNVEFVDIDSMG